MKQKKNKLESIKEFISWVISVGGLITGVVGLVSKSGFAQKVVYLMIIIDSLILVSLGIYVTIASLGNKAALEQKDKEISETRHKYEKIKKEYSVLKKGYLLMDSNWNAVSENLQVYITRLFMLMSDSMKGRLSINQEENDMRNHGYAPEELEEKTVRLAQEKDTLIAKNLYDDYKRFLRDILSKTQENVENYLQQQGFDLEVAVTIKQMIKPDFLSKKEAYTHKPCIYTAFRDSKTWSKRIRKEVVQNLYTISMNSDFMQCLSRGYYIFNNKKANSQDYSNENAEFDKYYNCGTTTLISSKRGNLDTFIYGFLACDVLNTKYDNMQIMDEEVATILSTAAHHIAIYFDNIHQNWYWCQIADTYDTFWKMIHDVYVNKSPIKQY